MAMTALSDTELGSRLLCLARQAIGHHLGLCAAPSRDDPLLAQRAATFVTLHLGGKLRGCMGSVRAARPLGEDVTENAVAAAFRDPRFPPVTEAEYGRLQVEVSLLSEPTFLEFGSEDELADMLEPGKHGVFLFSACRSATFLPQVWEHLSDPRTFLAALKEKAGLDPLGPASSLMAATYTVRKWAEPDAVSEPPSGAMSTS
jgi:uncharacterized protein